MYTILITGGSGFIGANLVRRLLQDNNNIHLLVRPGSDLWRLKSLLSKVTLHTVDLENFSELERIVNEVNPSHIYHLAASGVITGNPADILMSNVIGTFNLLKATVRIDYESFIHMGGSSEYGDKKNPMSEQDVLEPTTLYGLSKACSSLMAQQFSLEHDKPISILRAFSVYGPYESPHRLIPTVIEAAFSGKALPLTSPGFSRDYVFVEDVVNACLLCMKRQLKREIINIGTGIQTTNEKIVEIIEELTQKKITVNVGAYPKRASDKAVWLADRKKAKNFLGWEPIYDLKHGLQKTLIHYESSFS